MNSNPMYKNTPNGFSPYELMSGMQKFIRRGLEEEALYCFYELEAHNLYNVAQNRLAIIIYEDCGIDNPQLLNAIPMHIEQMNKWYKSKNGAWRLVLGNIILQACRGNRSRIADYFVCSVAFRRVNGWVLDLSKHDYVFDKHTSRGKKLGRGMKHFFEEAVKIVKSPSKSCDEYRQLEMEHIEPAKAKGDAWQLYRQDNRRNDDLFSLEIN